MCGITGILGRVDEANRAAIRRMADALAHRGPDHEGVWVSRADEAGRGCLLAHRRLSILDLSHAADQPMTTGDERRALVFNGEIYNFRELRRSLEGRGESFGSSGDTQVLLRLLAREGPEAVSRLRGMYAFAYWDDSQRRLVLARDPLGIKPIYVCVNPASGENGAGWSVAFASEVRALLASGLLGRPQLRAAAVRSVVWNGFVAGPETIVEGVTRQSPGRLTQYDVHGTVCGDETFWRLPGDAGAGDGQGAGAGGADDGTAFAATLRESVQAHLVSDAPLGVFLSSGVDSSSIAHLAQTATDGPVDTFTLAFEEASMNEAPRARAIAEAIGTRHHEITLTEQQCLDSLPEALRSLDQPTFDGLNAFYVSRAVREAGLKVALAGTGGDELFGGYTTFRHLPPLHRWDALGRRLPRRLRRAAAEALARWLSGPGGAVPPQTRWAKLPAMLDAQGDLLALYQLSYALFRPDFQQQMLDGVEGGEDEATRVLGLSPSFVASLREEIGGRSALSAISALEQRCFLGERLLPDTDAASMAVSLETRLPLVDIEVVTAANRMSERARYHPVGRKAALRRAGLAGLDPALFEQPKRGFVLPYDAWIRRDLGRSMDELMRDPQAAAAVGLDGESVARLWGAFRDGAGGLYWSRIWAIYVLIWWCHHHGVLR